MYFLTGLAAAAVGFFLLFSPKKSIKIRFFGILLILLGAAVLLFWEYGVMLLPMQE